MDKLEEIKRIFDNAPENNGPKKLPIVFPFLGGVLG